MKESKRSIRIYEAEITYCCACGGPVDTSFRVAVGEVPRKGHRVTLWMAGKEGEERALLEWPADCGLCL